TRRGSATGAWSMTWSGPPPKTCSA
ncbi:uncharacterized protein METZ01_LOCUS198295, partial [marine metagenome]